MAPINKDEDAAIWQAYSSKVQVLPRSVNQNIDVRPNKNRDDVNETWKMKWYELLYGGKKLRYTLDVFGLQPEDGYSLYFGMHGGGQDLEERNNKNWFNMTAYYRNSVKARGGVYISLRGLDNDWDLHFKPEAYVLVDKLITTLLQQVPFDSEDWKEMSKGTVESGGYKLTPSATNFVNSNRVYIMGFSAGGDGTYRHAARLPDRFAGANMSAGHPGEIAHNLENLANLPFVLQVGDMDVAYWRSQETVRATNKLTTLKKGLDTLLKEVGATGEYYKHECFLHKHIDGWAHNSWFKAENGDAKLPIYKDCQSQWLALTETYKGNKPTDNSDEKKKRDLKEAEDAYRQFQTSDQVKFEDQNTNAVNWVSNYTRNPGGVLPATVVWNLNTIPPNPFSEQWNRQRFFYWLYVRDINAADFHQAWLNNPGSDKDTEVVNIMYEKTTTLNKITFLNHPPRAYLGVLLKEGMIDFDHPVEISYRKQAGDALVALKQVNVKSSKAIKEATLAVRGDKEYMFAAALGFSPNTSAQGGWEVVVIHSL